MSYNKGVELHAKKMISTDYVLQTFKKVEQNKDKEIIFFTRDNIAGFVYQQETSGPLLTVIRSLPSQLSENSQVTCHINEVLTAIARSGDVGEHAISWNDKSKNLAIGEEIVQGIESKFDPDTAKAVPKTAHIIVHSEWQLLEKLSSIDDVTVGNMSEYGALCAIASKDVLWARTTIAWGYDQPRFVGVIPQEVFALLSELEFMAPVNLRVLQDGKFEVQAGMTRIRWTSKFTDNLYAGLDSVETHDRPITGLPRELFAKEISESYQSESPGILNANILHLSVDYDGVSFQARLGFGSFIGQTLRVKQADAYVDGKLLEEGLRCLTEDKCSVTIPQSVYAPIVVNDSQTKVYIGQTMYVDRNTDWLSGKPDDQIIQERDYWTSSAVPRQFNLPWNDESLDTATKCVQEAKDLFVAAMANAQTKPSALTENGRWGLIDIALKGHTGEHSLEGVSELVAHSEINALWQEFETYVWAATVLSHEKLQYQVHFASRMISSDFGL